MAKVFFTRHLEAHVDCPSVEVPGGDVHEVLMGALAENQKLRGYLLDDQNHLRRHVMVFVDGQILRDRLGLSDAVTDTSEVYVMQALSGG